MSHVSEPPPSPAASTVAVRWLGHATVLLELDGVRVLTDPLLRPRAGPLVRVARPLGPSSVGRVDCILLSHLHSDHVDLPSLRSLEPSTPIVAPHGSAQWLARAGIGGVRELAPGEETTVGGLRVIATPASHDGHRRPLGPVAEAVGYVVRGSSSAYFAGDTDLFPAMARLRGKVDVALLPVWGWGPSVGPGHLDPERAARAAAIIGPRAAIPIHWGTFAVARPARRDPDPALPARRFAALVARYAPAVRVHILSPGERIQL